MTLVTVRRLPAVLFLSAVAALLLHLVPTTAHAAPSGTYYVTGVRTGLNVAQSGTGLALHRPKGNEDHQQWQLSDGRFENTDSPGQCITRQLTMGSCSQGDTVHEPKQFGDQWEIFGLGGETRWYLTPVANRTEPMPQDPRLDQMTFLTAHNAYANGADGGLAPPFIDLAKNQTRGIVQQRNDGVRGFMPVIHQTPDGAILCHNSCTLVSKPVALNVDLQRIVDFLKTNRGEIITVFLEDYVDAGTLRNELRKVQGLNDVLYRAEGVLENGWPTRSHFRDVPFSGTATNDNGKLGNRAQQSCQPAARKKPNFLAVDLYHLGNAAGAVQQLNSYVYRP